MVYISLEMGIDTVQWRAAIGTFISSQKDMGRILFSSESRSSDSEDDFELDNQYFSGVPLG